MVDRPRTDRDMSGHSRVLARTISAVPVRSLSPVDRRLTRFVVGSTCVGLLFLGVGVWELTSPEPDLQNAQYAGVWFGALTLGVLAVGLPWVEVVRRIRRGDQEPGRHTTG